MGRGGVAADLNQDGIRDLLLAATDGTAFRYLQGTQPESGVWFQLEPTASGPASGGTRFTTDCGGWTKVDELSVGGGFGSIGPLNQKFVPIPWSECPGPVEVTIQWPSGAVQTVMVTEDTGEWTLQEPDWKVWSQEEDTFTLTVKPVLKNEAGIVASLQLTLSDGTEWPFEESGVCGRVFCRSTGGKRGLNGILEDASGSRGRSRYPIPGLRPFASHPSRLVAGQVASIRFSSQSIYGRTCGRMERGGRHPPATRGPGSRRLPGDPVPHRGGQPTQCHERFPAAGGLGLGGGAGFRSLPDAGSLRESFCGYQWGWPSEQSDPVTVEPVDVNRSPYVWEELILEMWVDDIQVDTFSPSTLGGPAVLFLETSDFEVGSVPQVKWNGIVLGGAVPVVGYNQPEELLLHFGGTQ